MMEQEMPHDDAPQDMAMIAKVLQKIVDDMNGLESDRIHPKSMKVEAVAPVAEEMPMEEPEEMTEDGLDPDILGKLMEKAGSADETGELPEDKEMGLPDEVLMAVKKKKSLPK